MSNSTACELKLFLKKINSYEQGILQEIYRMSNYTFNNKRELQDALFDWYMDRQYSIKKYGYISLWNTYLLTDMSNLFSFHECINDILTDNPYSFGGGADEAYNYYLCASYFNDNINTWDVSRVTNMTGMFQGCKSFNHPLDKWNVSKVESMAYMFRNCESFCQCIAMWEVHKVRNSVDMMTGCYSYKSNILDG